MSELTLEEARRLNLTYKCEVCGQDYICTHSHECNPADADRAARFFAELTGNTERFDMKDLITTLQAQLQQVTEERDELRKLIDEQARDLVENGQALAKIHDGAIFEGRAREHAGMALLGVRTCQ